MRVTTPISTISYNSDEFLVKALNELIAERKIEFWAFIQHLPEEDEKKPHKHLYIIPAQLIDTVSIQNSLLEVDVNNALPLGCIFFNRSKFSDWYLYALHDKDYLASKAESRKYHYDKSEIICSDPDRFSELIHTSDFSKFKTFAKFREAVKSGVSFRELFSNGFVPVQQIIQWKKAYNLMLFGDMDADERTFRAGRAGHEVEDVHGGGVEGVPLVGTPVQPPSVDASVPADIFDYIDKCGEIHSLDVVKTDDLPF